MNSDPYVEWLRTLDLPSNVEVVLIPAMEKLDALEAENERLRADLALHHRDARPNYPCSRCGGIEGVPENVRTVE